MWQNLKNDTIRGSAAAQSKDTPQYIRLIYSTNWQEVILHVSRRKSHHEYVRKREKIYRTERCGVVVNEVCVM